MMSREEAIKTINGVFLFNVKSSKEAGKVQSFFVDMRKTGSLTLGKGPPKPKPDVILTVNDRDMVALATGKMSELQSSRLLCFHELTLFLFRRRCFLF